VPSWILEILLVLIAIFYRKNIIYKNFQFDILFFLIYIWPTIFIKEEKVREAFKKWTLFWIVMVCVLFGKVDYLEANFTKYKNRTTLFDGKVKFGGRIRFRQEIKEWPRY